MLYSRIYPLTGAGILNIYMRANKMVTEENIFYTRMRNCYERNKK